MIPRHALHLLLLVLVLGTVDRAEANDMNAWLDRTRVSEGETVQLTLEAQGQVSGRPDTSPLEKDFEILGMSTGSRVNIVNGRTDARTTWALTLSPRRSGMLAIPALRVGNHQSEPLALEVSSAPVPVSGSGADILIETEAGPRAPRVQGQVLYTIRLLHAVPISSGRLSEPTSEKILVHRLEADREYSTVRDGRRYQVIERRYAIFPQTSGSLQLSAPVFSGEIPDKSRQRTSPFKRFPGNDPFFGSDPFEDLLTPTRRVRVRGEPLTVEVLPRPEAAQGVHWLPAERLELKGEWQPESASVQVGEPVSLILELEARGLTGGQLPSPVPESVDGFRVYPDQAQRQTDASETGVTGRLQQKVAFMPERTGELTLPAIEMHWWDTRADRERVEILPGRKVRVLPSSREPAKFNPEGAPSAAASGEGLEPVIPAASTPGPAQAAVQAATDSMSGPWPWVSAVLATGWLFTLVTWWRRAHRPLSAAGEVLPIASRSQGAAAARKQFLAACRANDAIRARQSLLAWSAAHWPADPPLGLEALAKRLHNTEAREALAELNRALYKEGGQWSGTRLAKSMSRLPKPDSNAERTRAVLEPLYPESIRETK